MLTTPFSLHIERYLFAQAERAGVDIITVEVGGLQKSGTQSSMPGTTPVYQELGLATTEDVLSLRQRVFEALNKHHTSPTIIQSKL